MFPLFSLLPCKYLIIYHRFPIFRMGKYRLPIYFQITFSLLKCEVEFLLTEEALQLQNSCCYYNALWKCEHYEFSLLDWLFNWKSLWDVLCVNTAVFGQTMRLDSWGVLSQGCLVTESQRVREGTITNILSGTKITSAGTLKNRAITLQLNLKNQDSFRLENRSFILHKVVLL